VTEADRYGAPGRHWGATVYIQIPAGLAQSEAPPLFVIGPDGKPALVNYRVRGTTYAVVCRGERLA
jgi:type IV secretion system protein VirB9